MSHNIHCPLIPPITLLPNIIQLVTVNKPDIGRFVSTRGRLLCQYARTRTQMVRVLFPSRANTDRFGARYTAHPAKKPYACQNNSKSWASSQ